MDKEPNGALKTAQYIHDAQKSANEKADAVSTTPATEAVGAEVSTEAPEEKDLDGYKKHADNDSQFQLHELDDGTNVEPGVVMENQQRHPAHQQHELAIEEDAPGAEQAMALMLPRGSEHYNEGGSVAEVAAGRSFGEA